jgi:hypothetical protein
MTPTEKRKRGGNAKWIAIAFFILVVLPIGGLAAWTWLTLHMSYSSGRARRVRAEDFEEGLGVQDVGRRTGNGESAGDGSAGLRVFSA